MKLTPELEEYKLTNSDVAEIFCKRFKELREAYRMSPNNVADVLGIFSRQSIVYYAMGNRLPTYTPIYSRHIYRQ